MAYQPSNDSRILAKRMEMGLKFAVGDHQAHGFKGRSITSNVHTLRISFSEIAEAIGLSAAALQIGLSKFAFNRVSYALLFAFLAALPNEPRNIINCLLNTTATQQKRNKKKNQYGAWLDKAVRSRLDCSRYIYNLFSE